MLQLDELFDKLLEPGREQVSWGTMAQRGDSRDSRGDRPQVCIGLVVSEENLKYLRERGGQHIVGTPKSMLRQFEQHLTTEDWTGAQAGVEVKLVARPAGDETLQARAPRGGPTREICLRCLTEPDEAQATLLHRLGLTLPRRLRRLDDTNQL